MENILILLLTADISIWTSRLLPIISKYQCQIEESRFIAWEAEMGSLMRISGNWDALAKLEDALANLKANNLHIEFKRISSIKLAGDHLPYVVQIVGINKSSTIEEITLFFTTQAIKIVDLQIDSFKSSYSDTKLLNLLMRLQVPANINIAGLREQFMLLCEETNVDGILEPEKTVK